MSTVKSGVPREISPGVFIGATDFREYSVGAGVPAGLTMYQGAVSSSEIIDEGAPEGKVFRKNDTADQFWGLGIDAFDGLWADGSEILMRAYINTVAGSGSRHKIGFGIWDEGVPGDINDHEGFSANAFNNSLRWKGGSGLAGLGIDTAQTVEINEGDPIGGFGAGYVWFRMRITDVGGGFSNWKIHFSVTADINNPPAQPPVWDVDQTTINAVPQIVGTGSKMGFKRTIFGPHQLSDMRWSFFSFSNEPIGEPPPLPSEVTDLDFLAPTVTVDPLQDTWVGLIGSPFESLS